MNKHEQNIINMLLRATFDSNGAYSIKRTKNGTLLIQNEATGITIAPLRQDLFEEIIPGTKASLYKVMVNHGY